MKRQLHGALTQIKNASQWRPSPEFVDLWLVEWSDADLRHALPPLAQEHWSTGQRERALAMSDPWKAQCYRWTQHWMARILARYLPGTTPVVISKDAHGRPHLSAVGPSFSLSHCGRVALLAVDPKGQAIGVDLEAQDPHRKVQAILRRFFSQEDRERFALLSPQEQCRCFFWWWTAKEALGKADGKGLSTELLGFSLPHEQSAPLRVDWHGRSYQLDSLGSWKGRQGALCRDLRRQSAPLRSFWLSQEELTSL